MVQTNGRAVLGKDSILTVINENLDKQTFPEIKLQSLIMTSAFLSYVTVTHRELRKANQVRRWTGDFIPVTISDGPIPPTCGLLFLRISNNSNLSFYFMGGKNLKVLVH